MSFNNSPTRRLPTWRPCQDLPLTMTKRPKPTFNGHISRDVILGHPSEQTQVHAPRPLHSPCSLIKGDNTLARDQGTSRERPVHHAVAVAVDRQVYVDVRLAVFEKNVGSVVGQAAVWNGGYLELGVQVRGFKFFNECFDCEQWPMASIVCVANEKVRQM